MAFWRQTALGMALWLLTVGPVLAAGQDYALTILHTNDVHAHLGSFDVFGAMCGKTAEASGKCLGGVARLATAIARERAKGGNDLLVDAGDQFQGTLYFTLFKGDPLAFFMNRLGYDAMTLGNHEFDDGPATLATFIKALKFPVVAANVDVSRSAPLRGLVKPYVVRTIGGRKVGIVGVANPWTARMSSPGPDVTFGKTIGPVRRAVATLHRQGVDIVVVLSHAGLEGDKKLAAAVPGVDVIVGGHSHMLLANGLPGAVGPCPLRVPHVGDGPTLVVTAGCWTRFLGVLHVRFDAAGRVVESHGNPVPLDASVPEDPATLAALARYNKPVQALRATVLGQSEAPMNATVCRQQECTPGDVLADAMLAAGRKFGAVAAVINGGSVRAGLPQGDVSLGDVLTAFPFSNALVTVTVRGADLAGLLERGLDRMGRGHGSGGFPQVAGLRLRYDSSKPPGHRLLAVQVADAAGRFAPLDPKARYRVAINSFLLRGGDGFNWRTVGQDITDTGLATADIVTDYIKATKRLSGKPDGRLQDVANPGL